MNTNKLKSLNEILDRNIDNHKNEIRYFAKNPIMDTKFEEESHESNKWVNKSELKKTKSKSSRRSKNKIDDLPERVFELCLAADTFPMKHNQTNLTKNKQKVILKSLDSDCSVTNLKQVLPPLQLKSQSIKQPTKTSLRSVERYSFSSPRYPERAESSRGQLTHELIPHYLLPRYRARFQEMCQFRQQIIREEDQLQTELISGQNLIQHLQIRLKQKLQELQSHGKTPNFIRLQVFAEIFDDLINESLLFAPLLIRIKSSYDNQVAQMLDRPFVNREALVEEVEHLSQSIYHKEKVESLANEASQLQEAIVLSGQTHQEYTLLIKQEEDRLEQLMQQKEQESDRRQKLRYNLQLVPDVPSEADKLQQLRMKIWQLMDDISSSQNQIKHGMISRASYNHSKDGLQDIGIELEKLNHQKQILTSDTDEMMQQFNGYLSQSDMPQRTNETIQMILSTNQMLCLSDYSESNKWSWYIS